MNEVLQALAFLGFVVASAVLLWNFYRILRAFKRHSEWTG
ncbi:hypothetical protein HG1285_02743 [Hydrogenivirga sp. 128-5-R1-1]|nr:hypothetical protein HG1285_02743 [Hydrogenivirga sp. 128-5-R1-1]